MGDGLVGIKCPICTYTILGDTLEGTDVLMHWHMQIYHPGEIYFDLDGKAYGR